MSERQGHDAAALADPKVLAYQVAQNSDHLRDLFGFRRITELFMGQQEKVNEQQDEDIESLRGEMRRVTSALNRLLFGIAASSITIAASVLVATGSI